MLRLFCVTLILFVCSESILAQKIIVRSKPDRAKIIAEGTSNVKKTMARVNLEERAYVYTDDHLPFVLEGGKINGDQMVDLVPHQDLIGDNKTYLIEFSKLVFDLPLRDEIGRVGKAQRSIKFGPYTQQTFESNADDWKLLMESELRASKVNMKTPFKDLFGRATEEKSAQFLLAAEVVRIWVSIDVGTSHGACEVKWSLFDKKKRKVVLETTSIGIGEGPETSRKHYDEMFANAAKNLSMDEDFITVILSGEAPEEYVEEDEIEDAVFVELVELPDDLNGSELIQRCIQSTVSIVRADNRGGSGVVVSADGYILTNQHVVGAEKHVEVIFNSGLKLHATTVRVSDEYDVALLKIDMGAGFSALPMALLDQHQKPSVGDDVFAIGTPLTLELGQSVTRGVISGKRVLDDVRHIQTDMKVNRGNSGGPLINQNGEVIGLMSWKVSGEGVEGLSFAVPIKEASKAINLFYD
jgi:serine protease Do